MVYVPILSVHPGYLFTPPLLSQPSAGGSPYTSLVLLIILSRRNSNAESSRGPPAFSTSTVKTFHIGRRRVLTEERQVVQHCPHVRRSGKS